MSRKRGDPVWVARDEDDDLGPDVGLAESEPLEHHGTFESPTFFAEFTYDEWVATTGFTLRKGQKRRVRIRVEEVVDE